MELFFFNIYSHKDLTQQVAIHRFWKGLSVLELITGKRAWGWTMLSYHGDQRHDSRKRLKVTAFQDEGDRKNNQQETNLTVLLSVFCFLFFHVFWIDRLLKIPVCLSMCICLDETKILNLNAHTLASIHNFHHQQWLAWYGLFTINHFISTTF